MLRKTAAMAVLILLIASLFSGSVGRAQDVALEQTDVSRTVTLETTGIAQTAIKERIGLMQFFHSMHDSGMPLPRLSPAEWFSAASAGDMVVAGGMTAGVMTTGVFITGAGGEAGTAVTGPGSSNGSRVANTTMMIKVNGANGSDVKVPDFPAAGEAGSVASGQVYFNDPGNYYTSMELFVNNEMKIADFGGAFAEGAHTGRVSLIKSHAAFFPAGSMSLDGRVALYRTNGGLPDQYDMKFENKHDIMFGNDTAVLTAHLVIPPVAGGENISGPGWPFPGYILDNCINIDMMKILDNGTITVEDWQPLPDNQSSQDSESSQDSRYNNEISAGESNWHSVDISDAITSFNVDLKWSEDSSPLELTVYAPDGSVLGKYDDSSDGSMDGRINLNIANQAGVAAGEWYLKVTDTGDFGSDQYYVKTY